MASVVKKKRSGDFCGAIGCIHSRNKPDCTRVSFFTFTCDEQRQPVERVKKRKDMGRSRRFRAANHRKTASETPSQMEALQRATGGCGRFQWMMVISVKLGLVPISWSMLLMAFGGMTPDWWCIPPPDYHGNVSLSNGYLGNWSRDNVTFQACEIPGSGGESCVDHVVFDVSIISTVISEWSLVCERKYIKAMVTSLQMAGVFVGALVAGQSSDTLGRRVTCYAALAWHFVTSLIAVFSVNWQMFLCMRVLIGMSLGAYLVASFPYCFEFVSIKHRQLVAFTPGWNVGVLAFAFSAWLLRDWNHLQLSSAIITVPVLLTWFIVPESARWLATKDRLQEAERVVQYVARVNRRPKPDNTLLTLQHVALEEKKAGQGRRYTYLDLFRGWRMATTTLILGYLWFTMVMTYYGISFGISALSGSFYLNAAIMYSVQMPVDLCIVFIANRLGRRFTTVCLIVLCSLSSFGILVVQKTVSEDQQGIATTALAVISKLAVSSTWVTSATLSSELYPTVVRILGYGLCNTVARVGAALSPLILDMNNADDVVRAYVIVGTFNGISAFLTLFLGETKGQDLQDSITIYDKEGNVVNVKANGEDNGSIQQTELGVWTVEGEKRQDGGRGENGQKRGDENGGKMEDVDTTKDGEESPVEVLQSKRSKILYITSL